MIDDRWIKADIDAHKYILEPNFVLDNIEKMVWHLDTIAGTPNAIGIMQLSKAAKEHVTVLLSGEGADEVFGGYWTFPQGFFWNNYVNFVSKTRIDVFNKKNSANYKRMEKGFDYYVATTHGVTSQEQFCMMRKKSDAEKVYEDLMDERMTIYNSFSGSLLDKHLKYKMATNLPDLLVRQDKMSMSASIENRVPFLDNDIVDFSFTVPENNLIGYRFPREGKINLSNVLEGKFLLKKLSEKTFGNDFTYRGKMGFSLPLNKYFSEKNFRNYFHDEIYSKMRDRDLINAEYILSLFEKGETMTEAEAKNIWLALNVEIWCQLFLDKKNYR